MKQTALRRSAPLKSRKRLRQRAHSTEGPTCHELALFDVMRGIGCLACILNERRGWRMAMFGVADMEIHHMLSGGVRIGHHAVMCLCHYHHQGKRLPVLAQGYRWHVDQFGPSFERDSRLFKETYGDQDSLLALQISLLESAL